jgi:hypothetical protein
MVVALSAWVEYLRELVFTAAETTIKITMNFQDPERLGQCWILAQRR